MPAPPTLKKWKTENYKIENKTNCKKKIADVDDAFVELSYLSIHLKHKCKLCVQVIYTQTRNEGKIVSDKFENVKKLFV